MKMKNKQNSRGIDSERMERELFGSHGDRPEDRTVSSRAHLRNQLSDEIHAFLSAGGRINEVEPLLRADPPRKPGNNYGRSIL